MSWTCGFCGAEQNICEQDNFCPRTILNKQKYIVIKDEEGEKVKFFTTASAAQAMMDYGKQVLLKENIKHREVLLEKTNHEKSEKHLE